MEKSVELSKEAVKLEIKDGKNWYVLGNAYLSNFFSNLKSLEELQNALKSY